MKERVRYFSDFDFDFVETKDQAYELSRDYEWIKRGILDRLASAVVYGVAYVISSVWCRAFLKMKIVGGEKLREYNDGAFIFANHTQPIGDVFIPALASGKRVYTLVSPANFGIPVIGKILRPLGALPIPKEIRRLRELNEAIAKRCEREAVVIYPEGHVWEYYDGVRPFNATAFEYPVKMKKAVFSLTTVYKKRKNGKKPSMEVYVDGPFFECENLPIRERGRDLCERVHRTMEERCSSGGAGYIKYVKVDKNEGN